MNIDRKLRTRLLTAVPVAALAFSLAACSGPVERPSAEAVAAGYQQIIDDNGQSEIYTDEIVLCLSEALVASEVSDQDLANIAAGKDEQTSTEAQSLLMTTISDAAPDCVPQD